MRERARELATRHREPDGVGREDHESIGGFARRGKGDSRTPDREAGSVAARLLRYDIRYHETEGIAHAADRQRVVVFTGRRHGPWRERG